MGKKELIIVIVFLIIGFFGGKFLIKAIKGGETDKKTVKTEKKKDIKEVEPEMDAELEIVMEGDWICPNHPNFRKEKASVCTLCNEELVNEIEENNSDNSTTIIN